MIYAHIYNHAIDKRSLFVEPNDYERFRQGLYYFNNTFRFTFRDHHKLLSGDWEQKSCRFGNPLLSILSYTLLPNHFHLFVCAKSVDEVVLFIRKLMIGFTMFFNKKYNGRWRIFAQETQVKFVTSEKHYYYLPNYIHLNILDLYTKEWRVGKCKWDKIEQLLVSYRWSSLQHYIGQKNDPIIDDAWVRLHYPRPDAYLNSLKNWAERKLKHNTEI